jgi:hypothetical protein
MTEIVRETTAERINTVCNDPAVRPWVLLPGQGDVDLTDVVANPANVVLMTLDGTGGIVFEWLEPGVYEAHTQFLPAARGRSALEAVKAMLGHMFMATDAMEILTKCPAHNRAAEALARAVGGSLDFERDKAWMTEGGPVAVRYYALRYADWIKRADEPPVLGEWFHDRLEAETKRLGGEDELHDDDPAHDRHVGAAVGMILSGQVAKGVVLYNRWARFSGYVPVDVVSLNPTVIDIKTHIVRVDGANFEVLQCL